MGHSSVIIDHTRLWVVCAQEEPVGSIVYDDLTIKALGFDHLAPALRALLNSMVVTQPVAPCIAYLACREVSIIDSGRDGVESISTHVRSTRTVAVGRGSGLRSAPV